MTTGIQLPSGQRYDCDNSFPTDYIIINDNNIYTSIDPSNLFTDRVYVVGNNGVYGDVTFNEIFTIYENGNIKLSTDGAGIILTSPDGINYLLTVDNSGNIVSTLV